MFAGDELQFRNVSPSKSPSPKKKRLSKHSPIRLLPSHRNSGKSPHRSPAKSPKFQSPSKVFPIFQSPPKNNPSKINGLQSPTRASIAPSSSSEESGMIAEGPYYHEAFCFMIKVFTICFYSRYFKYSLFCIYFSSVLLRFDNFNSFIYRKFMKMRTTNTFSLKQR